MLTVIRIVVIVRGMMLHKRCMRQTSIKKICLSADPWLSIFSEPAPGTLPQYW